MHRNLRLHLTPPVIYALIAVGCSPEPPNEPGERVASTSSALTMHGAFSPAGTLRAPHSVHTSTQLQDGRILIAGGQSAPFTDRAREPSTSVELYDPSSGTFSLAAPLSEARALHRAVLLNDGSVLITGGEDGRDNGLHSLASAELYQPVPNGPGSFTSAGNMTVPRQAHSATLLADGTVLIAGGYDGVATRAFQNSAELYNPTGHSFLPTGSLTHRRQLHTATLLNNNKVLIVGGISDAALPARAELYDPGTGQFTLTGSLNVPRFAHQATLLRDGRVLITGGGDTSSNSLAVAEVYDPALGTFTRLTASQRAPRQAHTATLLGSGRVLLAGGSALTSSTSATASAEIYDPTSQRFEITGNMGFARQRHAAVALGQERVLVVGGHNTANVLAAEIFDVPPPPTNDAGVPLDASVQDLSISCSPGSFLRCQGSSFVRCNDSGDGELQIPCANGCNASTRRCNACTPGARRCTSDGRVAVCNADGSGETVNACPADSEPSTVETCVSQFGDCRSVLTGPFPTGCGVGMTCVSCGAPGQPCCSGNVCAGQAICDGQNCVASCDDGNPCTTDTLVGSGASASCQHTPVAAGTICRASAGACDVPEVCDSSGAQCPADGLAAAGTVCRAANGACDVAESCTGSSAQCPADGLAAAGTVCRAANGVCDVAESCTGSSAQCPGDGFVQAGTLCRGLSGPCDVAEACTGASSACPADGFAATATVCRTASGPCDVAESCTGASTACPTDQFAPSDTVCRAASGACDGPEHCTGSMGSCPADVYLGSGTTCRAANGPCDVAEGCSGASPVCPNDVFRPSGTVCNATMNGVCDAPDTCSGTSANCANLFAPQGTTCRAVNGPCDVAETCTGNAVDCPADGFQVAGTVCNGTINGLCDAPDVCSGTAATCPASYLPAGTTCRAANGVCDVAESCTGGSEDCPVDQFLGSGTTCRPANGLCDVAEICTGASASCPPDGFRSSTTMCRAAADLCDAAEYCTGGSRDCPSDRWQPGGTFCRPATDSCDVTETCPGNSPACPPDGVQPAGTLCDESPCQGESTCNGFAKSCPPLPGICRLSRPCGINGFCKRTRDGDCGCMECPETGITCAGLADPAGVLTPQLDIPLTASFPRRKQPR